MAGKSNSSLLRHSDQAGWVSLHRRLLDHPRYRDSQWLHIWVHLLLKATHKGFSVPFAGKIVQLRPGQLITGRLAISRDTGVQESKVKRVLAQLKTDQQIDQQTSNKNSLITILNWTQYQNIDQQNGQQMASKRPADGQQVTTYNNENNGNNEIMRRRAPSGHVVDVDPPNFEIPTEEQLLSYCEDLGHRSAAAERFWEQRQQDGWRLNGEKIVNWKSVFDRFAETFEQSCR